MNPLRTPASVGAMLAHPSEQLVRILQPPGPQSLAQGPLTVHGASGFPARRADLDDHPPSALATVARRLEFPGLQAGAMVVAAVERFSAAVAITACHRFFASALIGIFRSLSIARS
jgi:hypothetical protein